MKHIFHQCSTPIPSENIKVGGFSDVFREYSSEILAENGLRVSFMSLIQPLIRGIRNFSEPEKFQPSSFGSAKYT